MINQNIYLGDALYACFDGYQISLKANDAFNPSDIVYLEPTVLENFLEYVELLKKYINEQNEKN